MQRLDKLYKLDNPVSSPLDDSVHIRHSGLRRLVQAAVDETSLRHVARMIGVSHGTLHQFVRTGDASEKTVRKIERWRAALAQGAAPMPLLRESARGYSAPAATGEDIASPDYDSLGIDLPGYERLHERPRREFDRFMVELIATGLGREDLEELGRGLLAPVAHLNTLHKGREESDASSEEDQMLIMNGMIPVLRKIVRERWRR